MYVFVAGMLLGLLVTMLIVKFAWWSIVVFILSPGLAILCRAIWWWAYARLLFKKSDLDAEATMGKYESLR